MKKKLGFYKGFLKDRSHFQKISQFILYDGGVIDAHLDEFEKTEHKIYWLSWLIKEIENETYSQVEYIAMTKKMFNSQRETTVKKLKRDLQFLKDNFNQNKIIEIKSKSELHDSLIIHDNDLKEIINSDNFASYKEAEQYMIDNGILKLKGKYGYWNLKKKDLCFLIVDLMEKGYFRNKRHGNSISRSKIRQHFEKRYNTSVEKLFKPSKLKTLYTTQNFNFIEKK